jgi:superfamily II DNA/RNA helicase
LRGVDVLVSTPGRLIDLINKGVLKVDRVSYMVFDEADRMLALEMEVQLRHIVTCCSVCVRQSVLFSATFPPAVERLVRSAVLDPIYIRVGSGNTPAETIEQNVVFVHSIQKRHKLLEILRETSKPPVLIFCNSHSTVDFVVKLLREEQFHAAGLHSDKTQPYRFRVMKAFKDGALDVLVATDVASRGIDVSDVTHVILFDMPDTIEDYIHRIGRTGRAGKSGKATAFLTLDCKIADDLKKLLKQSRQNIPAELQNTKQFGGEIVKGELRDYAVKKRVL